MKREYIVYVVFGILAVLLLLTFGYESGSTFQACRYWGGMMGGMMQTRYPQVAWGASPTFWIFAILAAVFVYLLLEERIEQKK